MAAKQYDLNQSVGPHDRSRTSTDRQVMSLPIALPLSYMGTICCCLRIKEGSLTISLYCDLVGIAL